MNATPAAVAPRSWTRDPRRWAFAAAGVVSVGLGWLGVFVPGLPTTVFLIIASYCFARSCPWLEERLLRVPVFAPYMRALDAGHGLSRHAATRALVSLWGSLTLSLGILWAAGRLAPWLAATIVAAGCVGSLTILYYARKR
ncbi:MAG TPA: YbaN family protein [Vicinamibacterales bacterium]